MFDILKKKGDRLVAGDLSDFSSKQITWINVVNPNKNELQEISKATKITMHHLKEYIGPQERPKVIELDDYSLIVFGVPLEDKFVKTAPIVIFVSKYNVITLSPLKLKVLEKVKKLPEQNQLLLFKNPTVFVYRILDAVLEDYFELLDFIEDEVEIIETQVIKKQNKEIVSNIFKIKKSLIFLHKSLVANREVITSIEKQYLDKIKPDKDLHFRELYNDVIQLIDSVETYREISTGIIDIYLSSISNNLNLIMKKLTAYAALVLVPTLISGIYGMNFNTNASHWNMPELNWVAGYPFAIMLMLFSVTLMYIYFKKNDWL